MKKPNHWKEIIEEQAGTGVLIDKEGKRTDVDYELTVKERVREQLQLNAPLSIARCSREISGTLVPRQPLLSDIKDPLTLVLSDGRKLKVFIRSKHSPMDRVRFIVSGSNDFFEGE